VIYLEEFIDPEQISNSRLNS